MGNYDELDTARLTWVVLDRLVPPENSRVLARAIPGARLLELHGAGHVFPVERERETVEALSAHFLGERAGAG